MEIRALRRGDDRSTFRSGDIELDRYFQKYAGQNQYKHFVGTTYVAVEADVVLGFATVAPGELEIQCLPVADRRGLPDYPLPVLRLARLAVDSPIQGQGLGGRLLRFVLRLAVQTAHDYGCVGVVVDAKPSATSFYERFGFAPLDAVEGASDARPTPTPMFLSMESIRGAMDKSQGKTERRLGE